MAYTGIFVCQSLARDFYRMSPGNGGYPSLRCQGIKSRATRMKNNNHGVWLKSLRKDVIKQQKYFSLIPKFAAKSESDSVPLAPSLSDVIRKLYISINEKNLKEIEDVFADDCVIEDSSFPHSFQGKKEVMRFISNLVESMGNNVHFRTGTVYEGGELIASLDWHLEWKEDQIPFSRGCSMFQCSMEDSKIVIRKAQIITESPFKPGELRLGLLKISVSLFDEFPKAAKWFLRSPHTIFKVVLHIYNLIYSPLMDPVLAFYIILWKFVVQLLGYVISILHFIAKVFSKMVSSGDPPTGT